MAGREKMCGTCLVVLPITDFGKRSDSQRNQDCIKCRDRAKTRKYYKANSETMRKRARDNRRNATPERKAYMAEYRKKYYEKNKEKLKADSREYHQRNLERNRANARIRMLMKKYGITWNEYQDRLSSQGGGCAICGDTGGMSHMISPLVVDHNHETGEVRGLLCAPCNAGLGQFGDDIDKMISAIAYLMSFRNALSEVGR